MNDIDNYNDEELDIQQIPNDGIEELDIQTINNHNIKFSILKSYLSDLF